MRIYVNGVEDGSVSQSGQLHLNMPLRVGRTGRVGFMDGVIDEVRAYNRALSAEEIQFLSPEREGVPPHQVLQGGWWRQRVG